MSARLFPYETWIFSGDLFHGVHKRRGEVLAVRVAAKTFYTLTAVAGCLGCSKFFSIRLYTSFGNMAWQKIVLLLLPPFLYVLEAQDIYEENSPSRPLLCK